MNDVIGNLDSLPRCKAAALVLNRMDDKEIQTDRRENDQTQTNKRAKSTCKLRWRVLQPLLLVVKVVRHFQYILELIKEKEQRQLFASTPTPDQVIHAALLSQDAASGQDPNTSNSQASSEPTGQPPHIIVDIASCSCFGSCTCLRNAVQTIDGRNTACIMILVVFAAAGFLIVGFYLKPPLK